MAVGRVPAPTPTAAAIVLGWLLLQGLAVSLRAGQARERDAAGRRIAARLQAERLVELVAHLTALASLVWIGWIPPTRRRRPARAPPHRGQPRRVSLSARICLARAAKSHRTGAGSRAPPLRRRERARSPHRSLRLQVLLRRPPGPDRLDRDQPVAGGQAVRDPRNGHDPDDLSSTRFCRPSTWPTHFFHEEAILHHLGHPARGVRLDAGLGEPLRGCRSPSRSRRSILVSHPHELPLWGNDGADRLDLAGYGSSAAANLQKHRFRRDPAARRVGPATRLHHDRERQPAAGVRRCWAHRAAPELPGRPGDGTVLVPRPVGSPTRCRTSTSFTPSPCWCTASGATTRCALAKYGRGLGGLLPSRALADPPGRLLEVGAQTWPPTPPTLEPPRRSRGGPRPCDSLMRLWKWGLA